MKIIALTKPAAKSSFFSRVKKRFSFGFKSKRKSFLFFQRKRPYFDKHLSRFIFFALGTAFGFTVFVNSFVIPKIFADDQSWTFADAGEYVVSDSSLIEVISNVARLKLRQYTSDANTMLHLKFDETSGNPADSSSNGHAATAANLTYATDQTGDFNNSGDFNGTTSKVEIPDSAALSLSQNNTLEAWVKFDAEFSPGSSGSHQYIVDKGDYRLYFHNETGKLTYELAKSGAQTWTQETGTDDNDGWLNSATALRNANEVFEQGGAVYAGLGSLTGDAEVWRYSSGTWTKIGGDGTGWSANIYEQVTAITGDGTNIYVGLGTGASRGEVWRWNGSTWSNIGGASAFGAGMEQVGALAMFDGDLYVGLGNSTDDGDVWRYDDPGWTQVGGTTGAGATVNNSWTNAMNIDIIYSMVSNADYLFVGTGNTNGSDDGDVWRYDGSTWTQVGGTNAAGTTLGSSWVNADNIETVFALAIDSSYLYAGTGNTSNGSGVDDAEVWRMDLSNNTWSQIGGNGVNSTTWTAASNYEAVYSLAVVGTDLIAGVGNSNDDADVWRLRSGSWTQIGGTNGASSVNSSWLDQDNSTIVRDLHVSGSTVYAALNNVNDIAEIWAWDNTGGTWSQIGGNYINKSWGFYGMEAVKTITTHDGKMYAGTGTNTANYAGDAIVWEYDGSTWTVIGGQGVNGSWTANTIETVNTMISYKGNLYVGLGSSTTANTDDGRVWMWDGSTWTQVGGLGAAGGYGGWTDADNIENVYTLAIDDTYLYAGIGMSSNTGAPSRDDGQVWRFDETSWTQIGGNNSSGTTLNSGWGNAENIESVLTLIHDGQYLYAGLGVSASDADVWRWNGSTWSQIGGTNGSSTVGTGSWTNGDGLEGIYTATIYKGELYLGTGSSTGDAEVWKYNGSSWTQVGGTNPSNEVVNDSWQIGTFEIVTALETYNGYLYAGIGNGGLEGEVWRFDGTQWDLSAGDTAPWSTTIDQIWTLAEYQGKMYAGLGNNSNVDAQIWSYGDNAVLESATSTFNTNWHYVVATYDESNMRLYIDDPNTANATQAVGLTIPNTDRPLLIGNSYGSDNAGKAGGGFTGLIDELRVSNTVRSAANLISSQYTPDAQTVRPNSAILTSQVQAFSAFSVNDTANGGTITYRLSDNGGTTWKYWSGAAWTTSASTAQANDEATINTNISTFPVTTGGILWQGILDGNGAQQVQIGDPVTISYTADSDAPTNPDTLTALSSSSGGSVITTNTWYGHAAPHFSWSGAGDGAGSGVGGYYVYFGTDNTADPVTAGTFQVGTTFTASSITSGQTYYLRIKARDNAQNAASTTWAPFIYRYDGTNPTNPSVISVSPAGYAATNAFTFSWPSTGANAATDGGSGVAGYQYKTGANSGSLSTFSSTITGTSIQINDAAYQVGENTFYLRTVDTAGNFSSTNLTATYYFAGEGASEPKFVTASPSTNTSNSFAFSWQPPENFSGNENELTYCYTVNTLPSADTCTFTSPGATSLSASSFATQTGLNTFYVVAKNSPNAGGAINYGAYSSATFTANTSAPGIPLNIDVADISVKSTEDWRLTISWSAPTDAGSGVSNYQIFRSTDDVTYTEIATTTGAAYVDTDLIQATYYYKVQACDNVNNCGAFTEAVSLLPTGKFTEAANLNVGPTVSEITTKQATISWGTDRESDSRIQFGTSAGSYFPSEPSNSLQKTAHVIKLTNLTPGTTYYYKAVWTDEDGNTGSSQEKSFTTLPAPVITDPKLKTAGLTTAALEYTVKGASKVKIYYGKTSGFGGTLEVPTSTSETTYTSVIEDLEDGTKYFYKINGVDSEGAEYEGNILTFETLPRPQIDTVRVQQVRGTAQPTLLVSWNTNTPVSSIVTFYPEDNPDEVRDEVDVVLKEGEHRMIIRGLKANTPYILTVSGRDTAGNEAQSERQRLTTATDTRPPQISSIRVEGSNIKTGEQIVSQLTVSWTTDEPSTSQVEFGEGTGTTYSQKTQEDTNFKTNHTVVITGLTPSKVYHLRALSKDQNNNLTESVDTVTIAPKATDDALNLVISNLQQIFGFLSE